MMNPAGVMTPPVDPTRTLYSGMLWLFIVHFAFFFPRRVLFSCTVKSWFRQLFKSCFFSLKMCLWDGSQHAKTKEVLQQAAFGKDLSG